MENNYKPHLFQLRCIPVDNKKYLLLEDVAAMLLTFAGSEETDIKTRLEELARNLLKTPLTTIRK